MVHAVYPSGDGSSALDRVVSAESIESLGGDAFDREALALAERSAGIGVWSIDLTTNRLRATAQFYRIMGVGPTGDTIPIETVRALRHPDDRDRVLAGFRQALQSGGDSYEIEYRIIRPDGNVRWIFGRGRVFRDRNGVPIRYSGVDLDITDRKATEAALSAAKQELERMNQVLEQRVRERTAELVAEAMRRAEAESHLRQAQKMQAVGQLTGGIAHDFNNVLQVIIGNLENVRLTLERDAQGGQADTQRNVILRATATATRAAQSATELVARLLAFGREQPLAPRPVDVNMLVGEMMAMIARLLGESIQIETALAPGVWIVRADRNQLESALLNLIVNARDAMPTGGRLVIGTSNTDVRETGPDDVLPGRYVMLSVRDTGSGIAPEHLPQVFKPFFTTKADGKGSGLGLAMVHGFVKQSGGHARVRSEEGSGTTVEIFLPVAPATAARLPEPPAAA
jgi:PAS domain S-box-containing protein